MKKSAFFGTIAAATFAAGFAAALAIRKQDRKAEITFVDKKDYDLMHPCGLPYALGGEIAIDNLRHSIGAEKMNIKINSTPHRVLRVCHWLI